MGFIDLHSHLLPGLDDGCQMVAHSLRCIERLMERGFDGSVCTPHILRSVYPENTKQFIEDRFSFLRGELSARDIDYQVWTGGEVRIDRDAVPWLKKHGIPSLGSGRHVLIDYFGAHWPSEGDELCHYLVEHGYVPVLAHPERLDMPFEQLSVVLGNLEHAGVELQGNLKSACESEDSPTGRAFWTLLREQRYFVLALDMHGPESLDERFAGLDRIVAEVGDEMAQLLLSKRPRNILCD